MRTRMAVIAGAALAVHLQLPLDALAQTCDADGKVADLEFVLQDIDGKNVALSDYVGQVILLDFWATWCAPCRITIPHFVELYDRYRSEGFVVLGVSIDAPGTDLRSFAEELHMNYPVLIGTGRDDFTNAYGPPVGYPTVFIIDRDGRICTSHSGFTPKEQVEQAVLDLL